ncbi:MAG: cell wall hydrolase [Firmicutes bacterium]|nr:cell wall hydrolase [Bacillota bacterium]
MPLDTRELFARLIQCEAGGEGRDGMMAVATVVMNRATVSVGEFSRINNGGDVRAIITQPGQFVCMRESVGGRYNPQNVYNMRPTQEHYEIVDWAMSGGRLFGIDNSLFFFNPYSDTCPTYFPTNVGVIHNRIGDHCFYIPTSRYPDT